MSSSDTEQRALQISRTLAETLSGGRVEETLAALTHAAVRTLPGVDEASISIRHEDGSIASYALTAEFLNDLDEAQYSEKQGPCYDGVTTNAFTVCGDLVNDPRYPSYGPRAAEAGIRSQAGVRIFESKKALGALNLYSHSLGAMADIAFLAELFSQHAHTAIAYAQEVDGLHDAMISRQLVGQAVGILMERFHLSDDRAFAFLARVSQDGNVKLRVIAQEIVDLERA